MRWRPKRATRSPSDMRRVYCSRAAPQTGGECRPLPRLGLFREFLRRPPQKTAEVHHRSPELLGCHDIQHFLVCRRAIRDRAMDEIVGVREQLELRSRSVDLQEVAEFEALADLQIGRVPQLALDAAEVQGEAVDVDTGRS